MIAAQALGIQFSGEYLFRGVSFVISPGDRIGLVGPNGAGKSTLMKILLGMQEQEEGNVARSRGTVIGYLPQEGSSHSTETVREEVMKAFSEVMMLAEEIEGLNQEIAARADEAGTPEFDTMMNRLGELQHRFEAINGFSAKGQVEKILMGLGFRPEEFDRPCSTFSGGWQMRIELAKLLLRQPDLLMLDEPTNHLDIESLTWLEGFLRNYEGAILLISHDRAFLDSLVNRIFEISRKQLTIYTGNYTDYLRERTQRREQQQAAYENQQKLIADTMRFVERFRYKATKAVQVQSRLKMLERIERIEPPEPDEATVSFRFPPAPRSGRVVAEMKGITKRYGDNLVLDTIDFALDRGQKVAFLGRNGEGKSTLSRIVAGIESYQGERIVGSNTVIGYFAQHQAEDLDPRRTVLETLDVVAVGDIRTQLRSLLGAFLFQDEDVFKPVRVLSGGEKSRLALAKLLLTPVNLLILDEPTNHLDMASKGVLKQALLAFEGAMIVVSHDRDFLDGMVTQCLEFKDRKIREYLGGIDYYLEKHQSETVDEVFAPTSSARKGTNASAVQADDGVSRKEQKRKEAELRNKRYAATKDLRGRLTKIEREVEQLEEEKVGCETDLADPAIYNDAARVQKLQKRLTEVQKGLTEKYGEWERIAARLEAAEAEFE